MITQVSGFAAQPSKPSCYLFVDGAKLRDRFGNRSNAAYGELVYPCPQQLLREAGAQKLFWFDCLPDGPERNPNGPILDAQKMCDIVVATPMCHFIGGYLSKGKTVKQKGVDVALAVYALDFALRGVINKVVLLAGDGDFVHLVNRLVQHGTEVTIWADPKVVASTLRDEADEFRPLHTSTIHGLLPEADQNRLGHPRCTTYNKDALPFPGWQQVEILKSEVPIYLCDDRYLATREDGSALSHPRIEWIKEWVKDGRP